MVRNFIGRDSNLTMIIGESVAEKSDSHAVQWRAAAYQTGTLVPVEQSVVCWICQRNLPIVFRLPVAKPIGCSKIRLRVRVVVLGAG